MTSIGLAVIAKDEEATLPGLLASVAGAFDQVALLDTGSTDRTVGVFEGWAAVQHLPLGYRVGRFEWRDDFAAARNAADELLETDWLAWADADDEIVGASELRGVLSRLSEEAQGVSFEYRDVAPSHERLRVVRRGGASWRGRLHEQLVPNPDAGPGVEVRVLPEIAYWRHRRRFHRDRSRRRNGRVLRRWIAEEPQNPRPFGLLAVEELLGGDNTFGVLCFARCAALRGLEASPDKLARAAWAFASVGSSEGPVVLGAEQAELFGWACSALDIAPDGGLTGVGPHEVTYAA